MMLAARALLTIAIGCSEELTVDDTIRDSGDGIGDAVADVGA